MNITKPFEIAFKQKQEKNWDRIYVAVDIHGTIFKPSYSIDEHYEFYPVAEEALRVLSARSDVSVIVWSSSHEDMLAKYVDKLEKAGIKIAYMNENPEVEDTDLASFKKKFYFNVGIDNNFGFEPETDWQVLLDYLHSI